MTVSIVFPPLALFQVEGLIASGSSTEATLHGGERLQNRLSIAMPKASACPARPHYLRLKLGVDGRNAPVFSTYG